MTTASENNKRIAKNTLFLYFRLMLTMFVSLFTSRVILNSLGVVDYGLNNVVAGVITLFAFLNNALGTATSRFLTFELGKGKGEQIKKTFCTAFNIHFCMAIIVVVFCETVGLWIVNNVLEIPSDRLFACNVIYQYVVVSAFLNITQVPLNALIISHERMNIYAYIGISDAILKLCIAYFITISTFDKLITLGTLNMLITIGMYIFYHVYCKQNFTEYNIAISREKKLYKEMIGFSSWSLLGASATMLKNQGINILINIFFGPVVNAANAIAYQVNNALVSFSNNFTTALNPQIIKSYANDDHERMKSLIFRGGKFSFFLLMILSIPILLETNIILHLWLKNVPDYTVILTRLVIFLTLIECFAVTVGISIQATGKIKNYQIFVAGIYMLNFPITYIFYKLGLAPTAALIVSIVLAIINIFVRLHFLQKYLYIKPLDYLKDVLCVSAIVMAFSCIFPIIIHILMNESIVRLLFIISITVLGSIFWIYLLGLQKDEKQKVKVFINNKLKRMNKKKSK
ncbi:MAG: lipopolysaccharide biosynthesis protein [Dysgonomonas sp.]